MLLENIKQVETGSSRISEIFFQTELIDNLYFNEVCDYTVKLKIEKGIRFQPFQIIQKEPKLPLFPIYRIRKNNLSKDENINSITPFSIPPDSCVIRGRANVFNRAVFYASNNIAAAITESRCQELEEIYLSVWHFESPFSFIDYLSTDSQFNSFYAALYQRRFNLLREKFSCYTKEECGTLERIIKKQAEWFLRETDYSVSAYVANKHLYETNLAQIGYKIDGILYPSIAVNKQAVNFAISRKFAENNLKCMKVFHLSLKETDNEKVTLNNFLKVGVCNEKKISWREFIESDLNDFQQRQSE